MINKMFASVAIALLLGQAAAAAPVEEEQPAAPYEIVRVEVTPSKSVWELRPVAKASKWFVDSSDVRTYEQGRDRLDRAPGSETEGLGRDQSSPSGYQAEPGRNR